MILTVLAFAFIASVSCSKTSYHAIFVLSDELFDEQQGSISFLNFKTGFMKKGEKIDNDDGSLPFLTSFAPGKTHRGKVTLDEQTLQNTKSIELQWESLLPNSDPIILDSLGFIPIGQPLNNMRTFCYNKQIPSGKTVTLTPC